MTPPLSENLCTSLSAFCTKEEFKKVAANAIESEQRADLDLANSAGNNAFQHGTSLIMQKVDLINDDQLDQLCVSPIPALASDDVPLLGCRHNNLRQQKFLIYSSSLRLGEISTTGNTIFLRYYKPAI